MAYQVLIPPSIAASEAPKAFGVGEECEGRRWVVHYEATVVPPRDGRFRFRGRGDDVLIVRWDGRNVLDGNISFYPVEPAANSDPTPDYGSMVGGKWINMKKGVPSKMEILIGECPGGVFFACLCLEEDGVKYPDGYPAFQLKALPIPQGKHLPVASEGVVFGVVPSKAALVTRQP